MPAFTVQHLFIPSLLSTYYVPVNVRVGKSIPTVIALFVKQKQELRKQVWPKNPTQESGRKCTTPFRSKLKNHVLNAN